MRKSNFSLIISLNEDQLKFKNDILKASLFLPKGDCEPSKTKRVDELSGTPGIMALSCKRLKYFKKNILNLHLTVDS